MNPKMIFLIALIAVGVISGWPHVHYQELLSQGDHGRDLYAFEEALRGKLPYKDFWWVYGPLMPFYYAFFYKICGLNIASVLLGKLVLKILCAVFFYLTAELIMPALPAFLSAVWFSQSQQDFFFTYNHIGGIAAELFIAFCLFSYITGQTKRLWWALPAVIVYGLIKINFGLASLAVILTAVPLIDHVQKTPFTDNKKKFYLTALLAVPAIIFVIYWLLVKDLPLYEIRQCHPYFGDDQPHHFSPLITIPYYFSQHFMTFMHSPINMVLGLVLHGSTIATFFFIWTKRLEPVFQRNLLLCMAVAGLFFVFNFHEFVVSGVWYRTFWSLPFLLLFNFMTMATALGKAVKWLRWLMWSALGILLLLGFVADFATVQQNHQPYQYLSVERGNVFVGNEPQWTQTVNTAAAYLNQTLKKDELFFALPYDCLYYFLTGKESPTRQLIFFTHIKIPMEQELSVIQDLERNHVNYVLMSNRIVSSETGMGVFGKDYCPLIAKYIAANFTPVARQGGNWQAEPGWGNNHGVIILKRKL